MALAPLLALPLPPTVDRDDIRAELSVSAFERRVGARRCSNRRMREELKVHLARAIEQAENVCLTTVVRDAWSRGQKLLVHAWVYGLQDGRVRELGMNVDSSEALEATYRRALAELRVRHGLPA